MHEINKSNNTVDLESIVYFETISIYDCYGCEFISYSPLAIYIKQM